MGRKNHGHWDQAIKNSSCLIAAVLRALKLEVGAFAGLDTVAILWDISAFFDSIRTLDVITMGLERECPVIILRLALDPGLLRRKALSGHGCRPQTSAPLLAVGRQSLSLAAFFTTLWTTCTEITGQCRLTHGLATVPNCT